MSIPRILGIGNAIVDVFAQADDSFLDLMRNLGDVEIARSGVVAIAREPKKRRQLD